MSIWDRIFPDDHKLAAEKYAGRESATDRARRKEAERSAKRRARHRSHSSLTAARKGQAWADAEHRRERRRYAW